MLNIKPIHFPYLDCFESCMVTITNYLHNEYFLLSGRAYQFVFRNMTKQMKIGDSISAGKLCFASQLKKYYGIYYTRMERQSALVTAELAWHKIEHKKLPILFTVDTFYLPWSKYYRQLHYKHFLIVHGVEKHRFLCIDPIADMPYHSLSFDSENFFHVSDIIIIHHRLQPIPYELAGKDSLQYVNINRAHQNLLRFKKSLFLVEDIDEHIQISQNDLWLCPFCHTLFIYLPGYRNMYANYLMRLSDKKILGQVDHAVTKLEGLACLWLSFYKNLMKLYYSRTYSIKKQILKPILNQMIEEEKQTGIIIHKSFGNNP